MAAKNAIFSFRRKNHHITPTVIDFPSVTSDRVVYRLPLEIVARAAPARSSATSRTAGSIIATPPLRMARYRGRLWIVGILRIFRRRGPHVSRPVEISACWKFTLAGMPRCKKKNLRTKSQVRRLLVLACEAPYGQGSGFANGYSSPWNASTIWNTSLKLTIRLGICGSTSAQFIGGNGSASA